LAAPAVERVYTHESTSILQLTCAAGSSAPPVTDPIGSESLVQLIRREGLDRLDGDFLQIGCSLEGAIVAKPGWANRIIQRESTNQQLLEGTRLAFAIMAGNRDPVRVKSDFRMVWKHLLAGGWAGFDAYAGGLPEVTAALNSLLTEYSGEIDRVERIKGKCVLLVRKRIARTEWKKL
jgi:hypothetical protein